MIEVNNGILGVKRDILMNLIDLMIFRKNSLIRNVCESVVFYLYVSCIIFLVDWNEWRKCALDKSFSFYSCSNLV
jgi:hypothetical protein